MKRKNEDSKNPMAARIDELRGAQEGKSKEERETPAKVEVTRCSLSGEMKLLGCESEVQSQNCGCGRTSRDCKGPARSMEEDPSGREWEDLASRGVDE